MSTAVDKRALEPIPQTRIEHASTPEQIEQVRKLFLEYAESLGFSLCFQSFDRELASLPGDYAPPHGRLLLGYLGSEPVGCVAMHAYATEATASAAAVSACEMKRLYVRPSARGHAVGRKLVEYVIREARAIGYKRMLLDTIEPKMKTAVALYRDLGFREIPPYRPNPIDGAMYMELVL